MYGKIFEQMYDGTLSADWKAMIVFQQLIVLADSTGVVDYTPPALCRRTGIPLDIIEHGLEKLQEPDPYSRSSEENGKRISLIDDHRPWGWYIVNYDHYKMLASREDRREKDRLRKQKARAKPLNEEDVQSCPQASAMSRHEDEDGNEDGDETTTAPPVPNEPPEFEAFKEAFPKRAGAQPWPRALKAIRARLKEGAQWDDILAGAKRYAVFCDSTSATGTQFVKQAATFCGPEKHYLEPWELPRTKAERLQDKNIDAGKDWLGASSGQ